MDGASGPLYLCWKVQWRSVLKISARQSIILALGCSSAEDALAVLPTTLAVVSVCSVLMPEENCLLPQDWGAAVSYASTCESGLCMTILCS